MMMSPPINPGENVQSHGWKKLRHLWRDVNSLYKEVLFNYTKSGNHESEFVNFCDGKMIAYYLRLFLDQKPGLNESVRAGLPEECQIESEKPIPSSNSSNISKGNKKRHFMENISESIGDLTRSLANSGEEEKKFGTAVPTFVKR